MKKLRDVESILIMCNKTDLKFILSESLNNSFAKKGKTKNRSGKFTGKYQ